MRLLRQTGEKARILGKSILKLHDMRHYEIRYQTDGNREVSGTVTEIMRRRKQEITAN